MKVCQTELPEEGLILVAARPGMGKSYVMIEMAHEMNQKGIKAMLLYTDGQKSHETVRYKEGGGASHPLQTRARKKHVSRYPVRG